ncbi:MAG TPA: pyrimidine dimer DNA glycosylase/endonuclease V [Gammaproteobacteria bacterium]
MRLWSIHPKYLDPAGLVALWRETLLAQKVLQNKTKGYKHHPQLQRFRQEPAPLQAIGYYLEEVYQEACNRDYCFDETKIGSRAPYKGMTVTRGQMQHEWAHLKRKLKARNSAAYHKLSGIKFPEPHPIFQIVDGEKEPWER